MRARLTSETTLSNLIAVVRPSVCDDLKRHGDHSNMTGDDGEGQHRRRTKYSGGGVRREANA
jgi:hypothetical protein